MEQRVLQRWRWEVQLVTESHLSVVRWKKASSSSHHGRWWGSESGGKKKLDIDLKAERWYTKDKRVCLLHKGRVGSGVRIDGWVHIVCQGSKLSEKSNFAWYQRISQFQQESHLWYLGEWASFYPSLPCLFLNRSLIDFPINHTHTHASKCRAEAGSAFQMMHDHEFTNSAVNNCTIFKPKAVLLLEGDRLQVGRLKPAMERFL